MFKFLFEELKNWRELLGELYGEYFFGSFFFLFQTEGLAILKYVEFLPAKR